MTDQQLEDLTFLKEQLYQIASNGSLSDGEFLDGPTRLFDVSPSPRLIKLPPSPLLNRNFDTAQLKASFNDGGSTGSCFRRRISVVDNECRYPQFLKDAAYSPVPAAGSSDRSKSSPSHNCIPQRDDFAENLPDLIFQRRRAKKDTNDSGSSRKAPADILGLRGGGLDFEPEYEGHDPECLDCAINRRIQNVQRRYDNNQAEEVIYKQRECCPGSTGCHLLKPDANDCACQKEAKRVRFQLQVIRLLSEVPEGYGGDRFPDDAEFIAQQAAPGQSPDSSASSCHDILEHHPLNGGRSLESAQPDSSHAARKLDVSALADGFTSSNLPTPHPKLFGELSDSDLHVRMAQTLDELRMLNLALAKRNQRASDPEESNLDSPESTEVFVGADSFYLSSTSRANKSSQEL